MPQLLLVLHVTVHLGDDEDEVGTRVWSVYFHSWAPGALNPLPLREGKPQRPVGTRPQSFVSFHHDFCHAQMPAFLIYLTFFFKLVIFVKSGA